MKIFLILYKGLFRFILSSRLLGPFNYAAVRLLHAFFVVTNPHKQDFPAVPFQCLHIFSVLYLLYRCLGRFLIFQLYHKYGLSCMRERQKYNIDISPPCRQFPDYRVILAL